MKKIELNKTQKKEYQILCKSCNNSMTRHKVKVSIDGRGSEILSNNFSIEWKYSYQVIECQGCLENSFRHVNSNSEDYDMETGEWFETELIYPKRSFETLPIRDYYNVPSNLRRIYRETIDCFNNDILTLCGAGVRAIVEGLCKANGISGGIVKYKNKHGEVVEKRQDNLQGKINGLHEKGKLTKGNTEILHEHRFLGNTAIHELSMPPKEDLKLAIEIIENVFESLYEIPQKGMRLKDKRLLKEKK